MKADKPKDPKSNQLSFKLATSLVADLMQKCDMPYALSVFLPESGLQQEILTKGEMLEVLGLKNDEHYMTAAKHEMTPLLVDLVEVIKGNCSLRPNKVSSYVQTEEAGESSMSLEQKLKRIDTNLRDAAESERLVPFKTLEERMIKYKKELEMKY
jgi:hypothetical protein